MLLAKRVQPLVNSGPVENETAWIVVPAIGALLCYWPQ